MKAPLHGEGDERARQTYDQGQTGRKVIGERSRDGGRRVLNEEKRERGMAGTDIGGERRVDIECRTIDETPTQGRAGPSL